MADPTTVRLSDSFHIGRASRYANPEFEDQSLPIIYGDLTIPSRENAGAYALPKIDSADGGVYCVAAHEISGAVALFDDDGRVEPESYSLELARNYQSKGAIATAAFADPPKGRVTAVCKGRKNDSGALIENPAEVIHDLMTSVWGFTEQDLDMQALSRAATSATALGYRAGGIILDDHAPADVLTSLLGDFLGRYEIDSFGRLKIHIAGEKPSAMSPQKVLPRFGQSRIEAEMARDTVINQVPVLYARDYPGARYIKHDDGSASRNRSSQRLYGVRRPPQSPLRLEWVRRGSVAATVQSRIVARYHEPTRMLTIEDDSLRALEIEPDDYLAYSVPWMRSNKLEPLVNQIGEVIEVSYDLGEQGMELKIRDTGFFLTSSPLLDGSITLEGGRLLGAERDAATYA
ncbi:MAG: hypothetical protein OXE44_04530 [Nitrospinae bacterium]|nr:hypothetical protein [Nitrospinota bacterium]